MKTSRQRLDLLLHRLGLAESRAKAQQLIYAGQVRVDGRTADKPGQLFPASAAISLAARPRFVGRGGEKLAYALECFAVDVRGRTCLDAGASTGGFTDCLLQHGATRVFAVDVGRGQLHWKLLHDPRVVVMDNTNARYLAPELFPERPSLATVDVSFISLTKVLPAVINVLSPGAFLITLVKPQFEVEREHSRGGVVRNPEAHRAAVEKIRRFGELEMRLHFNAECESPLRGPAGNKEFFISWTKA